MSKSLVDIDGEAVVRGELGICECDEQTLTPSPS
jgi:hypothetical protein